MGKLGRVVCVMLFVIVLLAVLASAGCGTINGFGKDLQGASQGIAAGMKNDRTER